MPILQMLRAFYGIDDQDPEQLAREKIAGRSLLLDPAFADDLPLIFDFLGVPDPERPVPRMDPEGRQRALADFLCRLVSNPARRKILVLIVEDLHWIDEGSQAMLERPGRGHGRDADAGPRQLPPRAPAGLGGLAALRDDRAAAARPRRHREAAARPRRRGPLARRDRRADPRAHRAATPSSSRRSSASWPSPGTCRASAAPTGWRSRSRTRACRSPSRPSSPPASTASTPPPSTCCRSPRSSARRSAARRCG